MLFPFNSFVRRVFGRAFRTNSRRKQVGFGLTPAIMQLETRDLLTASPVVEIANLADVLLRGAPAELQVAVSETSSVVTGNVADSIGNLSSAVEVASDIFVNDVVSDSGTIYIAGSTAAHASIVEIDGDVETLTRLPLADGSDPLDHFGAVGAASVVPNIGIVLSGISDTNRSQGSNEEGHLWYNAQAYGYLDSYVSTAFFYIGTSGIFAGVGNNNPIYATLADPTLRELPNNFNGGATVRGGSDDGSYLVGGKFQLAGNAAPAIWHRIETDGDLTTVDGYELGPEFEAPPGSELGLFFSHVVNTPEYPGLVVGGYIDPDDGNQKIGFWSAETGEFLYGIADSDFGFVDVEVINGEVVIAANGLTGGKFYAPGDTSPVLLSSLLPPEYAEMLSSVEAVFDNNGGLGVVAVLTDPTTFQSTRVVLTFDEVVRNNPEATYNYAFDFNGDGRIDQTVTGGAEMTMSHVFPTSGTFNVGVTVTNVETGTSGSDTEDVSILSSMLTTNEDGSKTLAVAGTGGRDTFSYGTTSVRQLVNGRMRNVTVPGVRMTTQGLNGVRTTEFIALSGATELVVYAGAEADTLSFGTLPSNIRLIAFGGDGNDRITGGRGRSAVFGEGGNDVILATASTRRDLVVGGFGQDSIYGARYDLVFSMDVQMSIPTIRAVLAAWDFSQPIAARAQRVADLIPRASITNDAAADYIATFFGWGQVDLRLDRTNSLLRRYFHQIFVGL